MTSGREIAKRVDRGIHAREEPFRCRFQFRALSTADQHHVDVTFNCSMRALPERAEREMLAEAFLSDRDAATIDDVIAHFTPPLKSAIDRTMVSRAAESWINESRRGELVETLREAARPVAFSCGVELLPPFELTMESPTLQREQFEAMQRRLAEKRAAGQVEHVQRAAELLKQFQSLRDAAPSLSPGQILQKVSDADRASMMQTLVMASSQDEAAPLWAVAGPNLVRIDPRSLPPTTEVTPLPRDLGPLRSVQRAELNARDGLLVGAQTGVMFVQPDDVNGATLFRQPAMSSQLGFNSVAVVGSMVWASHSDAGVVGWDLSDPAEPRIARAAPSARNLLALDDRRAIYTSAGGIFVIDSEGVATHVPDRPGEYVLIAPMGAYLAMVRADGQFDRIDRTKLQRVDSTRVCGDVTAAGTLPWLGETRLLLAWADGPVYCVGGDDTLVTQYASAHRGLRAIAGCVDTIAALSPDRQRIVLWRSWEGRQPVAEVHVAGLARHRAADVCF